MVTTMPMSASHSSSRQKTQYALWTSSRLHSSALSAIQ